MKSLIGAAAILAWFASAAWAGPEPVSRPMPDMAGARILGDAAMPIASGADQIAMPDTGWVWYQPQQCLGYQDAAGLWVQIQAKSGLTHRTNIVEVGQILFQICQTGSWYAIYNIGNGGGLNWTGLVVQPPR